MFATLSNGCATSTSGVLSIALSSLMIPVSISIWPTSFWKIYLRCKAGKKALTAGRAVYSNFPIRGTFQITKDDIGKYLMEDCLIIIDEAGVDFDNRKMKMTDEQVYFFKNHGHYQADIAFFSQSTDVDIKIRKLAVCHYEIKRFPLIRDLSYIKTIGRKIGIDDLTHQETEMFYYVHFLAGGIKLFWRRPYYKLFDTRYRHELPAKAFPKC